jgi:hypothetical protein
MIGFWWLGKDRGFRLSGLSFADGFRSEALLDLEHFFPRI